MKIVINKCFGGFGLSPAAVIRLAELRGQKAYFFTGGFGSRPREQVEPGSITGLFWNAYNTPTPTDGPTASQWADMTIEEKRASNAKSDSETINTCRDNRTDPLLIQVVEELGDKASGDCSKLKVIEIPDGIEYEIDDYDGQESVHEKHRSW